MAGRKRTPKALVLPSSEAVIPRDYADWLVSLKSRIASARQRATLAVNQELVRLFHHIGTEILERQTRQGWGAKVIDRLAADLRAAFPEMKGFSGSNLKYMRFFAEKCPSGLIGQQPADQLPWFHIVTLLTKVLTDTEREWYAAQVIQQGWLRQDFMFQSGAEELANLNSQIVISRWDGSRHSYSCRTCQAGVLPVPARHERYSAVEHLVRSIHLGRD